MKNSKKITLALAALSAFSVCGVGCGASGEKGTKLTVWCAQADQAFVKRMAKEFQKEHTDQKFDFRFAVQGENEVATKVLNDVEAAADVYSFIGDQISKLVNGDALARIGGERLEKMRAENDEEAVNAATVTVNNETNAYGFPYTDNTFFLYYDKSYFNEEDVKTLDGILAKCTKDKRFAMPLNDGWYNTSFYFGEGLGYSVEYTDTLAEKKITCDFDSEKGKKVTQALWETASNEKVLADADDSKISAGFADKSVVAAASGVWNRTAFEKYLGDNFAATKLPTYTLSKGTAEEKQVQLTAFAGYKMIGVNQYSKHKAEAMEFADYLTSEKAQTERFKERGFVPTNKKARENDALASDVVAKAITAQLAFSKTQKDVPSTLWTPMQGLGNAMITAAATGTTFRLDAELTACVNAIIKQG